jgi:hypothetical protein
MRLCQQHPLPERIGFRREPNADGNQAPKLEQVLTIANRPGRERQ